MLGTAMLGTKEVIATVPVKTLATARPFYEGKLGLAIADERPGVLSFRVGSTFLLVYESRFAGTNQATAATWSAGGDIEKVVADLKAKGVTFEHYDMPGPTDPAGHLHVNEDMKVASFRGPRRQHSRPASEPDREAPPPGSSPPRNVWWRHVARACYGACPSLMNLCRGRTMEAMNDFASARTAMVNSQVRTEDVTDYALLAAMGEVPRELFVPDRPKPFAYIYSISRSATISRRVILWRRRLSPSSFNLPRSTIPAWFSTVGRATGYSTAVLARIAARSWGVEFDLTLAGLRRRDR